MTPEAIINELADGLRDVIRECPQAYLESNPEDAFVDLAARLVFRLKTITLTPVDRRAEIERKRGEAAARILDIFTGWLTGHPERHLVTGVDRSGKFEVMLRSSGQTEGYFQGETIQDAYAQAAQTISFNEGELEHGDD